MRLPRAIAVCAAGAALAGVALAPAGAVTTAARPPLSVSVGPVRQLVTAERGGSVQVRFQLHNISTGPVVVTVTEMAFSEARNGVMQPSLAPGNEVGWLQLPTRPFIVQVNQTINVTGHLVLPHNAQPGDHGLAAAFASRPEVTADGTGATTVPVVLSELIVHVPGKAVKDVRYALAAGGLSWGGPVALTATVAEHGNVVVVQNGLSITGGGKPIRLPGILLLPGSERSLSGTWQPPAFCLPCTMRLGGSASADVWSLPGLPILGLVLAMLGGTGVLLVIRRNRRKAASRRHARGKPIGGPSLGHRPAHGGGGSIG